MSKIGFIRDLIKDPAVRFYYLAAHGFYHSMSDEDFIKKLWSLKMKYELNLSEPRTLCEKLQWLKIHDHNPRYTSLADKYEVKKIVGEKIGEQHVVPLLGVWDDFDSIDFDALPDSFVLKTTHDSGGFIVCKDKKTLDRDSAARHFRKALKRNFYWSGREWPYKNIKPRIIAEEYIPSLGHPDSIEYKLTCMNGKVVFSTICRGIAHTDLSLRSNDHFDRNNEPMPWYAYYEHSKEPVSLPPEIDEMIGYAETLAEGIPYMRVDFYLVDGRVYFGEMTFYTWGGFMDIVPEGWDLKLGEMLDLGQTGAN